MLQIFFWLSLSTDMLDCGLSLKLEKINQQRNRIAFAQRKISRGYQFAFVWGREAAQEMIKVYLKDYIANRSGTIQISCT